jgi:hypothetical protein
MGFSETMSFLLALSWDVLRLVWTLLAVAMSCILYRLGGCDGMNTKVRDFGSPLLLGFICLLWINPIHWAWITAIMVLHFMVCTIGYGGSGEPEPDQSFLFKYFGPYHFIVLGLLFGLAATPLVGMDVSLGLVCLRALLLGVLIHATNRFAPDLHNAMTPEWQHRLDGADIEELLRWFWVVSTFAAIVVVLNW